MKIILLIEPNSYCIPERFNTNILHQLFDNKLTFENSQREKTNLKGYFVLKNRFETFILKISGIQKLILVKNTYIYFFIIFQYIL